MTHLRTFALALVLAAALSLPSSASAASISDLIAQLKTIQTQLAQMKGQVLGVSSTENFDAPLVLPTVSDSTASQTPTVTSTKDTSPLVLPGYVGPTESAPSIYVDIVDTQASAERDDTFGDYSIEMEITANDGDIYIPVSAGTTERFGFDFGVFATVWKGTFSSSVSTMGTKSGNYIVIREGDSAFVDLEVYLDPDVTGNYGVRLSSVQYAEYAGGPLKTYVLTGSARSAAATDKLYLLGDAEEEERNVVIEPVDTGVEGHAYDTARGNFYVTFDVTAVGGDAFISAKEGLIWSLFGPQMANVLSSTHVLTSTAPMGGGYFIVDEEETERFTFSVDAVAKKSGLHRLELFGLNHAATAGGKIDTYSLFSNSDYKTDKLMLTVGTTTSSAKGSFTAKTLTAKKENPTIKGTASGTKTVGFSISNGDKVYGSGDIKVKRNGKWSHKVSEDLRSGTYDITLYANNVELAKDKLRVTSKNDEFASKQAIVVGVYEGYYPNGRGFRQHTEGTVTVNLKPWSDGLARPLVLTSYEATNWVINNPDNVKISKIITVGYYNQRVTGALDDVPMEHYSYVKNKTYYNAYEWGGEGFSKLVEWVEKVLDDGNVGAFYGKYSAPSFDVTFSEKG